MNDYKIAPSILSADFSRLGEDVKKTVDAGADFVHFDVMDNHYVPNLTIGPLVCSALRSFGIKNIIVGSLNQVADTCKIQAQLVNVIEGETEKSVEKTHIGDINEILPKIEIAAWELANLEPTQDMLSAAGLLIEDLEEKCNTINQTTAISIVFLMKAIAVGVNVSGDSINDPIQENEIIPDEIKDVANIVLDREASGNGSFWWALSVLDQQPSGGVQEQNFLIYVFYNSMTKEMREFFISTDYDRSLIYIDMPFMDVKRTEEAVNMVNSFAGDGSSVDVKDDTLVGVAAVTIEVNQLIVSSQWTSLGFALLFTVITLGLVFSSAKYAILTTLPVAFTVFMQWLVMDMNDTSLSLVTVMIGSILVGVGVDFSIHIANRVRELGGSLDAIRIACASTGMSLFEAATVTALGMTCAYLIDIPAIVPFVTVIIILLWIAAASALILLPAIFVTLEKMGVGSVGGSSSMARRLGLGELKHRGDVDIVEATLIPDHGEAW